MNFPIYHAPYFGNGMIIGVVAVIHVITSHGLAIGVFSLIALSEYLGFKKNSEEWENFAKKLIKPVVIIITVLSALTGVGIWFTTMALSPKAIGSMLRVFFWPWFFEWIIFTLEVIGILLYYFLWDKWNGEKKKYHVRFGLAYSALAVSSAVLITGIIAFMLTSGDWPWKREFSSAFFNPTFMPQLIFRVSISFLLGVVFTSSYLIFSKSQASFKRKALNLFGKIGIISLAASVISAVWYYEVIPKTFKSNSLTSVLTSHLAQTPEYFWIFNTACVVILFVFMVFSIFKTLKSMKVFAVLSIIFLLTFVSEFERMREFIRGPYLMPGYMYVSEVLLTEKPLMDKEGMLQNTYWYNTTAEVPNLIKKGSYLFAKNCSGCHTVDGLNDIRDRIKGKPEDALYVLIGNLHKVASFMPPFTGTDHERRILANFLYRLENGQIGVNDHSRLEFYSRYKTNE